MRSEDEPDVFGSESSFNPPIGDLWRGERDRPGYYIDLSIKAPDPHWPPPWLPPRDQQLHVATAQWGLGAYERYLHGAGEDYLAGAIEAGKHLLDIQTPSGSLRGGWPHLFPMPHTYRIDPPWLSAIAQGEGASLLARLWLETGDEAFARGARLALEPMRVPAAEGGTLALLDGREFVEEYPSDPPSFVLNGAMFALLGFHDVGKYLRDEHAAADFERLSEALAAELHRFDTGSWSLYDLHPHLLPNVASPAYHLLHINLLTVLGEVTGRSEFSITAARFQGYRLRRANRIGAVLRKIAFRLVTPRNPGLAHRLPRLLGGRQAGAEALVLCYHGISDEWDSSLGVTVPRFREQLQLLKRRGYRAVTFAEAAAGGSGERIVAITFDDAYLSVYEKALPELARLGMVATVFVPTAFPDSDEPMSWPGIEEWLQTEHRDELIPMSWAQLRELRDLGWEIGSHTITHPKLTTLPEAELMHELERSRLDCERAMGEPCATIAYPYGDTDDRVAEAAARAGYRFAAALPPGAWDRRVNPFSYPRVGIYREDDLRIVKRKISPVMRRLRRFRLWPPAASIWRRLRYRG